MIFEVLSLVLIILAFLFFLTLGQQKAEDYEFPYLTETINLGSEEVKKVLFVKGFGTEIPTKDSVDAYKHIRNYFLGNDRFTVEFFEYKPEDLLSDVLARLTKRVGQVKPDVLIGHSMGGMLTYRFMTNQLNSGVLLSDLPAPILLMAYLQEPPDLLYKAIKAAPDWVKDIKIPSEIGFKASDLWDEGNFLNGSYRRIPPRQVYDGVGYQAKDEDDLVNDLEQMEAMMIVARQDVNGGALSKNVLKRLRQSSVVALAEIEGKHEAFSSRKNSSEFFEVFDAMLDKL